MYHSVIGKRLVEAINARDGTSWSVRDFFNEIYVPLFFGSKKMLQNVNNSPFDQTFTKQKLSYTQPLLMECLGRVHVKVDTSAPDASFFLGGPAAGCTETTSGQVTSLPIPIDKEDVYASWIGAALGLTLEGGLTLLIDNEDVILTTYGGWIEYRRYLDQTESLKPLQVNAWNGQWLARCWEKSAYSQPVLDKDNRALETQKWVQFLFAICYHFRQDATKNLLAYVYSLGQSNKTIGFVRLNLSDVRRPVELYQILFPKEAALLPRAFEQLYQTVSSFEVACASTEIGLRVLEPKDVFHATRTIPKAPKDSDKEKLVTYNTYQTWIIAMLKDKDLQPRAKELAAALVRVGQQGKRGKSDSDRPIMDLLEKRNRREFIDELTKILDKNPAECEIFERIVEDLLSMTTDNIPLFLTLIRFQYAAVKSKQ